MQKNGKQGEKNTKIICFFGLAKHLGIGDSLEICGAGFPATCAVLQYSRYGTQSAHSQHSHTSAHSGRLLRIFLSKMGSSKISYIAHVWRYLPNIVYILLVSLKKYRSSLVMMCYYISAGHFFRFSPSPLIQLMLQKSF